MKNTLKIERYTVMTDTIEQAYPNQSAYLEALFPECQQIQQMRTYAQDHHIPVITPEIASALRLIAQLTQPKKILELGTAIGVSTATFAEAMSNTLIVSVELNDQRFRLANQFLQPWLLKERVVLLQEDIRSANFWTHPQLTEDSYDLIFVDAAKGQYLFLLEKLWARLSVGGVMIFDDVLQHGWVATLNYPNHRQKTAVMRLRQFMRHVTQNKNAHILPIDDGLLVLIKEGKESDE